MRLGQVKRTYNIETSKIVTFLKKQGFEISDHPNSKLSDEQLEFVLNALKPKVEEPKEVKPTEQEPAAIEKTEEEEPVVKKAITKKESLKEEPKVGDVIEVKNESPKKVFKALEEDEEIANVEVIRAPKQKVEGLKILGKIDLPSPKIVEKAEETVDNKTIEEVTKEEVEIENDPLAHLHPTKRAKLKAKEKIEQFSTSTHKFEAKKKDNKEKSIAQKVAEKQKQEKKKKKANPHRHLKKSGIQSQRIEVAADGTILPKKDQKVKSKTKELGFFAKIWKWFNT